MISNYGADLSIFEKCHHDIIFGKINFRIPLPSCNVREVWDHRKTNVERMQKAIQPFDLVKAFRNLSVDVPKVDVPNEILINIFWNYIPQKKVKCNYCKPPWINGNIKKWLRERSKLIKCYYNHRQKKEDREKLQAKTAYCPTEILKAKNDYVHTKHD